MTDPFLLDQKEVELTLHRLEEAVTVWRTMHSERRSEFSDSLEYELQGVESSIRNGIRDVKWSLEDLEETLKLMSQSNGQFAASEDLAVRRKFLESARKTLADVEFEINSPSLDAAIQRQQHEQSAVAARAEAQQEPPKKPERVSLLRADSDEEKVLFSRSEIPTQQQQQQRQMQVEKQQQPVATMVSLNMDTVRDLVEPPGPRRGWKATKLWLSRHRCWIFLLLLLAFFFVLVLMKALSRAAQSDTVTTIGDVTTTECPIDNFNCL